MKVSIYIAQSLDGFIARPDGSLDWLEHDAGGADYGYQAFMASVDVLVMGRGTFEMVASFGGAWPYAVPVVVLSNTMDEIPEALADHAQLMSGALTDVLAALAAQDYGHVYVDGGITAQGFIAAGLVDELIVTTLPILLGQGKPLFGPLPADVHLTLLAHEGFASGVTQVRYKVG